MVEGNNIYIAVIFCRSCHGLPGGNCQAARVRTGGKKNILPESRWAAHRHLFIFTVTSLNFHSAETRGAAVVLKGSCLTSFRRNGTVLNSCPAPADQRFEAYLLFKRCIKVVLCLSVFMSSGRGPSDSV